ncbi:hypothetical protein [Novosphingobium sp. RL4]|uniref:hypothetical protein n=1 Tax=Novosphingobium sp. RL4 TaxID=3109595 RepID=UPI002D76D9EB|nr:hypothetical protein [Novosphingobium sp. RL4]WRT93486.1 hypothetical protein U9J33_02970 [Novosphingobium sp. RL4]
MLALLELATQDRSRVAASKPEPELLTILQELSRLEWQWMSVIHSENDIPLYVAQRLVACILKAEIDTNHEGMIALSDLIVEDPSYPTDVAIEHIRGMSAMRGPYQFNLAQAPEQMHGTWEGSLGPLSPMNEERLWAAIERELGGFDADGRLRMHCQNWDGSHIVCNQGSAHRFALWWRLQQHISDLNDGRIRSLPATVWPISLRESSMDVLRSRFRLILFRHSDEIERAAGSSIAREAGFLYIRPWHGDGYDSDPAALFLPYPWCIDYDAECSRTLVDLHRRVDNLFDLGRYFVERAANYTTSQ